MQKKFVKKVIFLKNKTSGGESSLLNVCSKKLADRLTPCYKLKKYTNPDMWGTLPIKKGNVTLNPNGWASLTCDFETNGYRLPTEAEWEFASRGGNVNESKDESAWYHGNSDSMTHEVKTKKSNGYGLYDMLGNVYEWCWAWTQNTISSDTPATGSSKHSSFRSARGCSWNSIYTSLYLRIPEQSFLPAGRHDNIGFRIFRTAK